MSVSPGARTRSRTGRVRLFSRVSALVGAGGYVGRDGAGDRGDTAGEAGCVFGLVCTVGSAAGVRRHTDQVGEGRSVGTHAGTQAWSVLVLVPMVLLVTLLTLTVVLLRAGVESVAVLILMVTVGLSTVCRWGEGVGQSIARGRVCSIGDGGRWLVECSGQARCGCSKW